jgi:hypothetical protein
MMLLTSRRWGLLHFCLAGMEMAWLTPFFLLFYRPLDNRAPVLAFLGLFSALLMFILMLELLNFLELDWPFYELTVLGLIVISSLLFVRLWRYTGMPLTDFSWLANTLSALFDFLRGVRPELVLILTSVLLWQRAANATSRDLDFFSVGISFRLGLLLLILGASVFSALIGRDARPILWLYLGLGLTAVSLARTYDKATDARSTGSLLSLRRLGQLLLSVGVTVASAAWLSFLVTPRSIKSTLGTWMKPLWRLLSPVLHLLRQVVLWLLEPIFLWLQWLLSWLLERLDSSFLEGLLNASDSEFEMDQMAEQGEGILSAVPAWAWTGLRYLLILLAIAVLLSFVLLFLGRVRAEPSRDEAEEEHAEEVTLGGATLGRGVRWLRDMAGLVRRFGLSRQLLAAISVQNIYANLCRLARQRGFPRHPAQPPDDYLPDLAQAFIGWEEALARITAAYMQVHYGDQPLTTAELARIRQDYQRVRAIR